MQYPNISTVLLVIGVLRLVNKPLFALLHYITKQTPTVKDDQALEKVEKSLTYKVFLFTLDWLASFKLPETKPETKVENK